MDKAKIGSPDSDEVLTIGQFLERYPSNPMARAVRLFCPDCSQETHVRLSLKHNRADHFAHGKKTPGTPLCREREQHGASSRQWYDSLPDDQNARPEIIAALRDPKVTHFLWTAVNVILNEQYAKPISVREFHAIAKEVDQLGRWVRKGMTVDIVPQIILNHGDFISGKNHILFPIKRDNREHRPILTPITVYPDGTTKRWKGYELTREESLSHMRDRPKPSPCDPMATLVADLRRNPPERRLSHGK